MFKKGKIGFSRGMAFLLCLMMMFVSLPAGAMEIENFSNRISMLYSSVNGLPSSEANAICQTENGYIWIGSYAGLIRYDAKKFTNVSETEGIPAGIRALYEGSDGTLWIGTNDDGMYRYSQDQFVQCFQPDGTATPSVRSIVETADGMLYVGTTAGLYFLDGEYFSPVDHEQLHVAIDYLAVDANGTLWGCGSAASIFAYRDGQVLGNWEPGQLYGEGYKALGAYGNYVYVGTFGSNVLRLDISENNYTDEALRMRVLTTAELHTINTISPTADGTVWVGADNGVGYLDSEGVLYTDDELLDCVGSSQIIQDYEGNLWIASSKKGVYQISEGGFYHDQLTAGLSINATSVTQDAIFIATDTGLRILDKQWKEINIPGLEVLRDIRIRDVLTDSQGLVWICTYSDLGLFCYDTKTGAVTVYTEAEGLLNSWTRKAMELSDGRVAILTYHGINFIKDGVVLEDEFGADEGIKALPVLCLVETANHTLYAGTDGDGLYSIRDGKLQKEQDGVLDGLSVILTMAADPENGGVWFGSGNDLFFVDENGAARKLPKFTTGVGSVFDIVFAGEKVILTKSEGIYIVDRQRMLEDETVTSVGYGLKDGLRGNMNANSRSILPNQTLYLASSDGINLYPLSGNNQLGVAPRVFINEIVVQREMGEETVSYVPQDGKQTITIPSDTRRLMIRFACLSFAGRECTVEYSLSGFDMEKTVVSASDESTATYTNLPGGEYTFVLRAVNSAGLVSEVPVQLNIRKELTLWERPLVKVAAVLLALLAVFLFFWFKTRQIRKDHERYRAITHQSLETIANTIDAKDSYTKGHSVRVATYSRELARRLNLSEREQEEIYFIALLHDIGKIGTPDAILNKPGKLTQEEFDIIRKHTVDGEGILSKFPILPHIGEGARWHHERIDGNGYPDGLKGDNIPYLARIICVADAFDAMSTNRPYRNALDMEKIVQELEDCKNTQFQPEIVDCMVDYIRDEEKKLSASER